MTTISKNVYTDESNDKVYKYNDVYHRTVKMNAIDVKSIIYIDVEVESNNENPKFKFGGHVRISNIKIFFAKG